MLRVNLELETDEGTSNIDVIAYVITLPDPVLSKELSHSVEEMTNILSNTILPEDSDPSGTLREIIHSLADSASRTTVTSVLFVPHSLSSAIDTDIAFRPADKRYGLFNPKVPQIVDLDEKAWDQGEDNLVKSLMTELLSLGKLDRLKVELPFSIALLPSSVTSFGNSCCKPCSEGSSPCESSVLASNVRKKTAPIGLLSRKDFLPTWKRIVENRLSDAPLVVSSKEVKVYAMSARELEKQFGSCGEMLLRRSDSFASTSEYKPFSFVDSDEILVNMEGDVTKELESLDPRLVSTPTFGAHSQMGHGVPAPCKHLRQINGLGDPKDDKRVVAGRTFDSLYSYTQAQVAKLYLQGIALAVAVKGEEWVLNYRPWTTMKKNANGGPPECTSDAMAKDKMFEAMEDHPDTVFMGENNIENLSGTTRGQDPGTITVDGNLTKKKREATVCKPVIKKGDDVFQCDVVSAMVYDVFEDEPGQRVRIVLNWPHYQNVKHMISSAYLNAFMSPKMKLITKYVSSSFVEQYLGGWFDSYNGEYPSLMYKSDGNMKPHFECFVSTFGDGSHEDVYFEATDVAKYDNTADWDTLLSPFSELVFSERVHNNTAHCNSFPIISIYREYDYETEQDLVIGYVVDRTDPATANQFSFFASGHGCTSVFGRGGVMPVQVSGACISYDMDPDVYTDVVDPFPRDWCSHDIRNMGDDGSNAFTDRPEVSSYSGKEALSRYQDFLNDKGGDGSPKPILSMEPERPMKNAGVLLHADENNILVDATLDHTALLNKNLAPEKSFDAPNRGNEVIGLEAAIRVYVGSADIESPQAFVLEKTSEILVNDILKYPGGMDQLTKDAKEQTQAVIDEAKEDDAALIVADIMGCKVDEIYWKYTYQELNEKVPVELLEVIFKQVPPAIIPSADKILNWSEVLELSKQMIDRFSSEELEIMYDAMEVPSSANDK